MLLMAKFIIDNKVFPYAVIFTGQTEACFVTATCQLLKVLFTPDVAGFTKTMA